MSIRLINNTSGQPSTTYHDTVAQALAAFAFEESPPPFTDCDVSDLAGGSEPIKTVHIWHVGTGAGEYRTQLTYPETGGINSFDTGQQAKNSAQVILTGDA